MKRFLRILFNTATMLSLVLSVMTVAMWTRSRYVRDLVTWMDATGRARSVDSCAGTAQFVESAPAAVGSYSPQQRSRLVIHQPVPPGATWNAFWGTQPNDVVWEMAGFALITRSYLMYPPGGFTGGFTGFGGQMPGPIGTTAVLGLVIPYWSLALIAAALPVHGVVRWWKRRRTSRRMKAGCCVVCGYDLRATPDRCPECGKVPEKLATIII